MATTATKVASLPVPAVVGTATKGTWAPRGRTSQPAESSRSLPAWARTIPTPLAVSITDPPPTAMRLSHWAWR